MVPGEIKPARKEITINEGKNSITLKVANTGALTDAQINDTTIKRSLENAKIKGFIK